MEDTPKSPTQEHEKKPNLKRKLQPEESKEEKGDYPLCCREIASNLSSPKPKRIKEQIQNKQDSFVDVPPATDHLLSNDTEKVYYTNVTSWMIENERRYFPNPNALAHSHPELNPFMRVILIEWLSEVSEELNLPRETFMLAINCIDWFLSVGPVVPKSLFQLVGITALWIATKNEELNIRKRPQLESITEFTDNIYTLQDVHKMEDVMLHSIGKLVSIEFR